MPRWSLCAVFVVLSLAPVGCGGSSSATFERSAATATTATTLRPAVAVSTTTTSTTTTTTTVPGLVAAGSQPPVVSSGPAVGDAVALTFDADLTPGMQQRLRDGRVASYANTAVVEVLQSTGTPATIFFTGLWMEEYPDETAAIVADHRFELGTHSQTHRAFQTGCYGLPVATVGEMAHEVQAPIDTLTRFTDRGTRYFRFPGLCHDATALAAIAPVGVTVVDGDSSGDAGGTSVQAIVDQTLARARPGAIIVMHLNGGDAAPLTDEALPQIIEGLRARGLRPATLSEVLAGA